MAKIRGLAEAERRRSLSIEGRWMARSCVAWDLDCSGLKGVVKDKTDDLHATIIQENR